MADRFPRVKCSGDFFGELWEGSWGLLKLAAEKDIENVGTDGKVLYGNVPDGREETAVVVAVVGIVDEWKDALRERF